MIEEKLRKVIAITITALMFAGAFVVVPQNTINVAGAETNDIIIDVVDDIKVVIPTATVKLTEVHTGKIVTAYFDGLSYVATAPWPGHYITTVTAEDFYDDIDPYGFTFDGTGDESRNVQMTKFGEREHTCNVTVENSGGYQISNAEVMFFDRAQNQEIISNVTDGTGYTELEIFSSTTMDLVVIANGYETHVEELVSISGDFNRSITLNNSAIVWGKPQKASGEATSGVVGYMYNTNDLIPWEKRVIKSSTSILRFDAYVGDWILIIDGPDVNPYIRYFNISSVQNFELTEIGSLEDQTASIGEVNLTLADWNTLTITDNETWRADHAYPGLAFSDIGSLRAQIDLAIGDGDGMVELTEWLNFTDYLDTTHGPNYVSTSHLLTVNDTQYLADAGHTVSLSDFSDLSVISTDDIIYNSTVSYQPEVTLDAAAPEYIAHVTVPYDDSDMDWTFDINIVSGYELFSTEGVPSDVDISGYLHLTIDPPESTHEYAENMQLTMTSSEEPIAKARISIGSLREEDNEFKGVAYAKRNETDILQYYIVRNDTAIKFSAVGSSDPNGHELNFTWDFGDGTAPIETDSLEVEHNYTAAAKDLNVTLRVRDVSGLWNETNFSLWVDALAPRVAIDVGTNQTSDITIEQGDTLEFSPEGTEDDLISVNDGDGEIQFYEWTIDGVFKDRVLGVNESILEGEGNESLLNITHTFEDAGTIEVLLNVTDVVGNWANATISIIVADVTSPSPVLGNLLNETGGVSLKERALVIFDALNTTDNVDDIDNLTFEWDFGDDSTPLKGNGSDYAYVNHTYADYGQFTLTLNVTDNSTNTGTLTRLVSIGTGPRPSVMVDKITSEPDVFEEGVEGTITVNITNQGSADAKNITVEVWHYDFDEPEALLGTITTFYSDDGSPISSLAPGDTAYGTLKWTPGSKGNYTLRAIANSTDQPSPKSKQSYVVAEEAGWKKIALYGGILAILVVIPLLVLARRRIASGASMRRPRREKESKK